MMYLYKSKVQMQVNWNVKKTVWAFDPRIVYLHREWTDKTVKQNEHRLQSKKVEIMKKPVSPESLGDTVHTWRDDQITSPQDKGTTIAMMIEVAMQMLER